jgi:hypothetical protein
MEIVSGAAGFLTELLRPCQSIHVLVHRFLAYLACAGVKSRIGSVLVFFCACEGALLNLGDSDPRTPEVDTGVGGDAGFSGASGAAGSSGASGADGAPFQRRDGCTVKGCEPAIVVAAPISDADEASRSFLIEVCLNDACSSGTFTRAENAPIGTGTSFPDRVTGASVGVFIQGRPGVFVFYVQYSPRSHEDLRDGDQFSVMVSDVRDSAANIVVFVSRVLTYEVIYPNGRDCDPLPCREATIFLASSVQDGG